MPVTFQPANHQANPLPPLPQWAEESLVTRILRGACIHQFKKCGEILQSSLDKRASSDSQDIQR